MMIRLKFTVVLMACLLCPAVQAEDAQAKAYQDYLAQQRGAAEAQDVHDIIVPLVTSIFTRNHHGPNVETTFYPNPNYVPYPNTISPYGYPSSKVCYQQNFGGPLIQIPCY